MFQDEPLTSRTEAITPGEDLSDLGVEQLTERLETLRQEMARTESAIKDKKAGLSAAEAFFSPPGAS
ncbi:DUF1192 domain-containing protein [Oceanicaulis alexandrii]|uniref:DUF1192 domain-containing protein n=1 Tax=Oceanicaulis TaxID=153232 RepID=UPI0035D026DA